MNLKQETCYCQQLSHWLLNFCTNRTLVDVVVVAAAVIGCSELLQSSGGQLWSSSNTGAAN